MTLREELERSGNWLFRWRSYLPVLMILPEVLAVNDFHGGRYAEAGIDPWGLACLGISLVGLSIRIVTVGYVPKGTSGRNTREGQVAESLNTTGMYSLVRHPLYLGNFISWLGISLYPQHWWLCVIFVLAFWLYYERIVFAEEEFLYRKFGRRWLEWAQQTPTFIPRLWGWKPPELPFSLRTVLRREYSGLLSVVGCFYGLELYSHAVAQHRLVVHPVWTTIFVATVLVYLTLRTLKKTTSLLAVEGR